MRTLIHSHAIHLMFGGLGQRRTKVAFTSVLILAGNHFPAVLSVLDRKLCE